MATFNWPPPRGPGRIRPPSGDPRVSAPAPLGIAREAVVKQDDLALIAMTSYSYNSVEADIYAHNLNWPAAGGRTIVLMVYRTSGMIGIARTLVVTVEVWTPLQLEIELYPATATAKSRERIVRYVWAHSLREDPAPWPAVRPRARAF